MLYPYSVEGKDSPKPELVIDRSLLEVKDEDLNDASKFASKIKSSDATGYIVLD